MFANRRRFEHAVAKLDPTVAFRLARVLYLSELPFDRAQVLALLDRAATVSGSGAKQWADALRAGMTIKLKTFPANPIAGDELILAETAREVATDPGVAEALRDFQPE
jgi:hypothetical protein